MTIDLKNLKLMPSVMCMLLTFQAAVTFNAFGFLMPLSYLTLFLCIFSFLVMVGFFLRHPQITLYELTATLFCVVLIILTTLNATDIKNALYQSIDIWLLLLLFNYYHHNIKLLLESFAFAISACAYINVLMMLLFPDWIFATEDGSYLLGGNYNQMGCRFITGLILNHLCIKYRKVWIYNTIVFAVVAIFTLAFVGSMTSLSCIILFIVLCLIPSIRLKKWILGSFFVFYLLFHLFVVFSGESLHNNELAVYIVEDVLEKDITFTNRTGMWDAALRIIEKSPLVGYGFVDNDWYLANMSTFARGPHNFVLALLVYGGIFLLPLFIATAFLAIRKISDFIDHTSIKLLLGTMTFFFMMTFEVYPLFFAFFLLTLIFYYPHIQASWTKAIVPTESPE